jgi:glycerol-3-phosphate dehydrogenase
MANRQSPHVVVVGAGSTGSACAYDLALRGFKVTVVERGEVASGTTGRNHCLLHSGGRYAVKDPVSAVECIQENAVLRRIMPDGLELNDGLFVALDEADLAFKPTFMDACEACGIPAQELRPAEALALEPGLNPNILAAVRVPDGVYEPYRLCLMFLATAMRYGATVLPFSEVVGIERSGNAVTGVRIFDRWARREERLSCDMVVNAAGPWAGRIAAMAGVHVPVVPSPGVMVSVGKRFTNMVINRLNLPSDGDIVVPQRCTSIVGTTSWTVDDPDFIPIPDEHVELLLRNGERLIPGFSSAPIRGVFAVARPLIGTRPAKDRDRGRELSRTFECFDHAHEGVEGFVTISGGKTTTARAMAEKLADLVCSKLGIDTPCQTREATLLSHRHFFHLFKCQTR